MKIQFLRNPCTRKGRQKQKGDKNVAQPNELQGVKGKTSFLIPRLRVLLRRDTGIKGK